MQTKNFDPNTMTRATQADIDRIWHEVWGDVEPMQTGPTYITDTTGKILFVVSSAIYTEKLAIAIMDEYNLNSVFVYTIGA